MEVTDILLKERPAAGGQIHIAQPVIPVDEGGPAVPLALQGLFKTADHRDIRSAGQIQDLQRIFRRQPGFHVAAYGGDPDDFHILFVERV